MTTIAIPPNRRTTAPSFPNWKISPGVDIPVSKEKRAYRMAMNKAETEQHHAQYHAVLSETREALQGGDYKKAVDLAVSSWEHIDGMMQY